MNIKKYMCAVLLIMTVSLQCADRDQELVFKVLQAGAHDGAVQAEIVHALRDPETSLFVAGVAPEQSAAVMARWLQKNQFILCYKDGELVAGAGYGVGIGYDVANLEAGVIDTPTNAYVALVFVAQEYRRQGIGNALMQHLIETVKQKHPHVTTLQGDVVEENNGALRFYEALGARRISEYFSKRLNKVLIVYTYDLPNSD